MKKLENMNEEEFMEAWTAAAEKLDEAKAKCQEFQNERRRRDAQKALDDLPDEQKKLFAQLLAPAGIESEESVQEGNQ